MSALIASSFQLASTGCAWPVGLVILGALLVFAGIAATFGEDGAPCGCIATPVGILLIAWVIWGDDTGFCDLN
ncbi:hypothetical protein [Streptomyces xantholiticus]|uniref:Uncharacterized protein n=1 Tax=Streptomyces xantholiticus TaxID=68285 RepID=A0ABV1UZV1_9ACTN